MELGEAEAGIFKFRSVIAIIYLYSERQKGKKHGFTKGNEPQKRGSGTSSALKKILSTLRDEVWGGGGRDGDPGVY